MLDHFPALRSLFLRGNVGVGYGLELRGHRLFKCSKGTLQVLVGPVVLADSTATKGTAPVRVGMAVA